MKIKQCALLIGAVVAANANAQSVQIYGLIDSGVMYTSNVGGKKLLSIDPDSQAPDLFGFVGSEDLGAGTKAIFKLEGQFNMNNGAMINGLFGHTAYVGLQDEKWGTLTAGNQIDFMFDSLVPERWGPAFPIINAMNLRQSSFELNSPRIPGNGSFDFDRLLGSAVPNSIKYKSPTYNGFSFGGLYSFGGVAGNFGSNSAQSFGVNYRNGGFSLNGAYTYIKYPELNNGNDGIRNYGVGASWMLGAAEFAALYTNTANTQNGARIGVYEADVTYALSTPLHAHFSYQYQKGNHVLNEQHVNQETLSVVYLLSKRTSLFSTLAFQQSSGGPAWILMAAGPASGGRQAAFSLGLIHSF
ncbi:porin [Paraburkholderia sp. MMS20-SJTN17]|uniref:Porin n=1 Tax=Paraburkholderia translucens TaxID=2886945 RepID=A0ABS8KKG9_9BURK|nr:porin [Paraburkholderia sp. MMS20-SJTN17]MCC8405253.1 porin [Paraburkholderia sp. MMS20-SJTN17]